MDGVSTTFFFSQRPLEIKESAAEVVYFECTQESDVSAGARFAMNCYNDPANRTILSQAFMKKIELEDLFNHCARNKNFYELFSIKIGDQYLLSEIRVMNSFKGFKQKIDFLFYQHGLSMNTKPQTTSLGGGGGGGAKPDEKPTQYYYDLGVAVALRYFEDLPSDARLLFENVLLGQIDVALKHMIQMEKDANGKDDSELSECEKKENFTKGYFHIVQQLQQNMQSEKSASPKQKDFNKGVAFAKKFHNDPSNRSSLLNAFENREELTKYFHDYSMNKNFHLEFCLKVGDKNMLQSGRYSICLEGFIEEMNSFFKEHEGSFRAQFTDPEDLAREINGEVTPKPTHRSKKKKTAPKSLIVVDSPLKENRPKPQKVSTPLPTIVQKPIKESKEAKRNRIAEERIKAFEKNVSDGVLAHLEDEVNEQEVKVQKMEKFHTTLTDPEKIAASMDVLAVAQKILVKFKEAFAKIPKVEDTTVAASAVSAPTPMSLQQTHETKEFSVPVRVVLMLLGLTNRAYEPLDLSGRYTEEQIQTLKICVLFMINTQVFAWTHSDITQAHIAEQLCIHLPDNDFTPRTLYDNLYFLDPISVLVGAGFRFCS